VSEPVETTRRGPRPGWDALARAALRRESQEDTALRREFVTFHLDGDSYALPIEAVREIVRLRPITPVPRVPAPIRGVISLRGEVVQVLDLRLRLGLPLQEPTRATRVMVLHGDDGGVTGLLVDSVRDVLRIPEEQMRSASGGDHEAVAALLVRGDEFVSLLDIDRVLDLEA
jgi:purine-binding chemotaxis protein CheW